MLRSVLTALLAPAIVSAAPAAQPVQCEPAPPVVQRPNLAANSTYTNDGEPPRRFSAPPKASMKIAFGRENIDALCGRPPCGFVFEGCVRGDTIALPDPFTTDSATFARITRHELAHVHGWPETHGD
jgi:hypothetical protein